MSIRPWASFATWLHLEAPLENTKKINKYWLSNIELVLIHMELELGVLGIGRKLSLLSITLYQKNSKRNLKFTSHGLPKIQLIIILLIGTLGVENLIYTSIFANG